MLGKFNIQNLDYSGKIFSELSFPYSYKWPENSGYLLIALVKLIK